MTLAEIHRRPFTLNIEVPIEMKLDNEPLTIDKTRTLSGYWTDQPEMFLQECLFTFNPSWNAKRKWFDMLDSDAMEFIEDIVFNCIDELVDEINMESHTKFIKNTSTIVLIIQLHTTDLKVSIEEVETKLQDFLKSANNAIPVIFYKSELDYWRVVDPLYKDAEEMGEDLGVSNPSGTKFLLDFKFGAIKTIDQK